ncbi:MAG: HU family DNA-binding protein [Candidatus Eremiobacteraeota bacterium]|nr:HU family DNA-binding protein [Candidatus Eremiobacteraeota bacterium]
MMGKRDVIEHIAKKTKLSKKDTEMTMNAFMDVIKETLKKGMSVRLIPFGNFEVRHRAARTGRNPRSGAKIKIKARNVPAFRPGKALKDAVQ